MAGHCICQCPTVYLINKLRIFFATPRIRAECCNQSLAGRFHNTVLCSSQTVGKQPNAVKRSRREVSLCLLCIIAIRTDQACPIFAYFSLLRRLTTPAQEERNYNIMY